MKNITNQDENHYSRKNKMLPQISLRQYAAIKLKVPNSGTDWLDEMITTSLRDDFASKALQATISRAPTGTGFGCNYADTNRAYATAVYAISDAMLEARSK